MRKLYRNNIDASFIFWGASFFFFSKLIELDVCIIYKFMHQIEQPQINFCVSSGFPNKSKEKDLFKIFF